MTTPARYIVTVITCAGWMFCVLSTFMWAWEGDLLRVSAWLLVGLFYCWLLGRRPWRVVSARRPDYARIADLERELGIGTSQGETR